MQAAACRQRIVLIRIGTWQVYNEVREAVADMIPQEAGQSCREDRLVVINREAAADGGVDLLGDGVVDLGDR